MEPRGGDLFVGGTEDGGRVKVRASWRSLVVSLSSLLLLWELYL